jgi:hypothetical protein
MRRPVMSVGIVTAIATMLVCPRRPLLLALPACPSSQAVPTSSDPTSWTDDQWRDWRDQQINRIFQSTFDLGNDEKVLSREEVITRAADAFQIVEPVLKRDPNFFSKDPILKKNLTNFVSFIKAQHWMAMPDHGLGLPIADTDYVSYASNYASFPELLRSQEFLTDMSSPRGYKAAVDLINKNNLGLPQDRQWTVLPFKAQFILSVDKTTYGRMLVLVPNLPADDGGTIDKWILFAIATPDQNPPPDVRSVSIVAVHRKPGVQSQSTTYLLDFMRQKNPATGEIKVVPADLLPSHPSKNCYDCHKAAVLPIRPQLEYEFDATGKLVEKTVGVGQDADQINQLIWSYGLPNFAVQDVAAYGPSLGPVGERSDEFIRNATSDLHLSSQSYARIRVQMNCASCHDTFAPLNYLQAVQSNRVLTFLGHKGMIQTYIEKGYMPPGADLTDAERTALWRCLTLEYLDLRTRSGLLIQWLKGGPGTLSSSTVTHDLYRELRFTTQTK